jgi:hypothetical protein
MSSTISSVEVVLDRPAQLGLPGHVLAEQVAGGDVRDVEVRGDHRALRSLARTGRRHHQHPHVTVPSRCRRSG